MLQLQHEAASLIGTHKLLYTLVHVTVWVKILGNGSVSPVDAGYQRMKPLIMYKFTLATKAQVVSIGFQFKTVQINPGAAGTFGDGVSQGCVALYLHPFFFCHNEWLASNMPLRSSEVIFPS